MHGEGEEQLLPALALSMKLSKRPAPRPQLGSPPSTQLPSLVTKPTCMSGIFCSSKHLIPTPTLQPNTQP